MAQEIYIHAGAHRTGTSSFQLMLSQNRKVLRRNGILPVYPKRDGAPGGRLRLRLPGPGTGPRRWQHHAEMTRDEFARHLGGKRPKPKMLISEENIPGRMLHFYSGQFFPSAPERLQMLAETLDWHGVGTPRRLVYVIRSYAELFVSAYRKRAEDNPVGPFDEIAPKMAAMDRGWPELIASFQTHLAPQEIIVVPYRNRGRSVNLLTTLLGAPVPDVEEPDKVVNLSATDAALEALQRRYHTGETLERAAWQEVVSEHADDRSDRGFAAFSAAQRATLEDRYQRDCTRIAEMPGVTYLG